MQSIYEMTDKQLFFHREVSMSNHVADLDCPICGCSIRECNLSGVCTRVCEICGDPIRDCRRAGLVAMQDILRELTWRWRVVEELLSISSLVVEPNKKCG